ncbi:MAG: hypothetical protein IKC10_03860 [Alphaproteobacteria bacterium]|nr:hypothetical protein [Alphaproteobacteria bacterium]
MMFKFLAFFITLFSAFTSNAQMLFDDVKKTKSVILESASTTKKVDDIQVEEDGLKLNDLMSQNSTASDDISKALSASSTKSSSEDEKDLISTELQEDEDVFIPEGELYRLNTPTNDGSQRGGQAFVEVDEKGRMKKAENIFLFYDEFKITNYMANTATCDVRFNILSNLDRKITQLDVKLVWPDITTTLSFSDISPNTQTYYNYSLIGNGCYGMDVAPNIIVNRCRVKGFTASECASKLLWLSK